MAAHGYNVVDLETVATRVLFGPRRDRIDVMNAFRAQNGDDAVDYLVNAQVASQEDVDDALEGISNDSSPTSGDIVLDSEDLEVVFRHALVSGRKHRLDLVNLFRTPQGEDEVEYLVNARNPLDGEFLDALESVAEAEED